MATLATPSWLTTDGDGGSSGALKTGNANTDGTGTVNTLVTAPVGGCSVSVIKFRSAGTNVATVARIFLNNGSTHATPTNNYLFREVPLPETTLVQNDAMPSVDVVGPNNLPNGWKVLVTIGQTVAAGWYVSPDVINN